MHGHIYICGRIRNQNTSILYPSSPKDTNVTFGFAPVCPTGYCKPGITEVIMTEQDSLCQHHRTGVLCGRCEDEYSLVLGTIQTHGIL